MISKVKARLNGNTGLVITTGMIFFLIAIVSFGFMLVDRVDAVTEIKVENKMYNFKEDITKSLNSIDKRLAVIESKVKDSK